MNTVVEKIHISFSNFIFGFVGSFESCYDPSWVGHTFCSMVLLFPLVLAVVQAPKVLKVIRIKLLNLMF